MSDVVTICNLALAHCASSRFLDAIDDNSTEGRLCTVHYEPSRDAILREMHWPFARRFVALALVAAADAQPWATEWGFAYRYPANCIRIRRLLTNNRRDPVPSPYELGSDASGRLIFTDLQDAVVAYTHKISDAALFSEEFTQAVAWRMAFHMSLPLTGRTDLRAQADEECRRVLADAKIQALGEQVQDDMPDAEWIRARET